LVFAIQWVYGGEGDCSCRFDAPLDREIQIGGPEVTTYGGMIDELARALDRRPPLRLTVPVLTPASPRCGSAL
jgi:hypothetical protein